MALTKPNQELCRDLKSASHALEEAMSYSGQQSSAVRSS